MLKFKISVSKNQKKHTIIFDSISEAAARKRVHNEWYSILWIEKIDWNNFKWNLFIFKWIKNWEIKTWKVAWDDIFKIYLKLTDWLGYEIINLFLESDKWLSEEEKNKNLKRLKEQYIIYKKLNTQKEKKVTKLEVSENIKENTNKNKVLDNFYMKKELEDTYELIDFVLKKLKNVIEKNSLWEYIDSDSKEKFKKVYNAIIKLRNSTNVNKLKEVWEIALIKVWEYELIKLEEKRDIKSKILIKSTNKLLKQFWSKKQFIEKDKDIKYQINKFYKNINSYFKKLFKKEKITIDKSSYYYLNILVAINKFKEKKSELNKETLKKFYVYLYPFWAFWLIKNDLSLKRKVINQNLILLIKKRDWKLDSYTKIKKWYKIFLKNLFWLFLIMRKYILIVIFYYSLFFIFLINFSFYSASFDLDLYLNYIWIFYFISLILVYFGIYFSKWFISLGINFIIVNFLIIFWLINF